MGTLPMRIGRFIPVALMPDARLCPGPSKVGRPPPLGEYAILPLSIWVVWLNPPPGSFATWMRGIVPRIPAVPTGESILKLDSFFSFLTSTTISPRLKSIMVSEGLGSSFRSVSLPMVLGSNFS